MKILNGEVPPVYDQVLMKWPVVAKKNVIFCWGDSIYNPGSVPLDPSLILHEETHSRQQEEMGGPEKWWEYYLDNNRFRYDHELEAHIAEAHNRMLTATNRADRRAILKMMAEKLSSPIYGNMVRRKTAESIIKTALKGNPY